MEKLNFVWSKVDQKSIDPKRIDKLKIDLNRFDKLYLAEKQEGEHEKKKSESLKEIDKKLEQLLERYDLDNVLRAFRIKYKYEKQKIYADRSENSVKTEKERIFKDPRLIKLWNHAKMNEDLLSEELEHIFTKSKSIDDKIITYNRLLNNLKEERSNHVHEDESDDQMRIKLKKMNQEIENELQEIDDLVSGANENPFTEKKARKLWLQVRSLKHLTEDQIKSFRTDIRQYEKQLIRVSHHQHVLNDAKSILKTNNKEKENIDDEELSDLLMDQEKLERKAKKLETWLNDKIKTLSFKEHEEL